MYVYYVFILMCAMCFKLNVTNSCICSYTLKNHQTNKLKRFHNG